MWQFNVTHSINTYLIFQFRFSHDNAYKRLDSINIHFKFTENYNDKKLYHSIIIVQNKVKWKEALNSSEFVILTMRFYNEIWFDEFQSLLFRKDSDLKLIV